MQPPRDMIGPLSHIQPPPANYAYPNGTTYVYNAEWAVWSAGTATIRMEPSGKEQHVTATADSTGFAALLYKVHDRFQTSFAANSFCSLAIQKKTEEGTRRRDTEVHFDYARRKGVLNEINLNENQKKQAEHDIPGCVTDIFSGLFYLASLPLQPGSTFVFPLDDGAKTVDVHATVEARERIRTDAGTFSTLRVRPEVNLGVLKNPGYAWIWYTEDAPRIPVRMRARMRWGTVTLTLQSFEKQ
ncbi:MAG: DUF3108 domain-containing protein [Terriglobales bacterium]|jgi:hypothetical protein